MGDRVLQADGQSFIVLANADDKRPGGVLVFNFAVDGNHTYFVEDGAGESDWAWVHNKCASAELGDDLIAAGYRRGVGEEAAHLIPTSTYANAKYPADVKRAIQLAQSKFDTLLGASMRNRAINGFFAKPRHLGTHTKKFFRELGRQIKDVKTETDLANVLDALKARVVSGEFA